MEKLHLEFQDVSIKNGVEIIPFDEVVDINILSNFNEMLILGNDFLFKMNIDEASHPENSFYFNFRNWVSYVIFAGIANLSLRKSKIDLKLGLSLHDFYQNHAMFANLITKKSFNYLHGGISKRKSVELINLDILPNIYCQGLFLSKLYNFSNFVLISFSKYELEGILFNPDDNFLMQKYVVGKGYNYFLNEFNTELKHGEENRGVNGINSYSFKSFFNVHLKKKISYLVKDNTYPNLFIINDCEVDKVDFGCFVDFVRSMVSGLNITVIEDGPNMSCHGLYETYSNTYHSKMEKVAVSVYKNKSTFLSQKNHCFRTRTKRSEKNMRNIGYSSL